jgi:hypothetical protein
MRNYFKQFTGKIKYTEEKVEEFLFDFEQDDLTDEIEKSLLEIRDSWNIPDDEIAAALESRKKSKRFDRVGGK